MKKIMVFCLIISYLFSFCLSGVFAADYSQRYLFVRDFIDCLAKLKTAAAYPIEKDTSYELMLERFRSQLTYLKQAKKIMANSLASQEPSIKTAAWYIDTNISLLNNSAENIVEILNKPLKKKTSPKEKSPDISSYVLQYNESWKNIYGSCGYLMQAIKRPFKTINPQAKIPFLIPKAERQNLVSHINNIFKEEIKKYEKSLAQKKKGADKDIEISIPGWTAISLRSLLSAQTYGDIEEMAE